LEQANIVEGMQWLKKQKNPDVLSEGFAQTVIWASVEMGRHIW
jgi:hypothetical protein